MLSFRSVVVCCAILATDSHAAVNLRTTRQHTGNHHHRGLDYELIAGFEPTSVVTDHNAIDLDQKAMEDSLGLKTDASLAQARLIYTEGGHSKSYAELVLESLSVAIQKDDEITGKSTTGGSVTGKALEDTPASTAATVLKVQYKAGEVQAGYSSCQVGGLPADQTNTDGCLATNGTVTVNNGALELDYSYNPTTGNNNARTLQGFSTKADTSMRVNGEGEGAYYADFQKFVDYYGAYDYADQYIDAAFGNKALDLKGKVFDFSGYDADGQSEAIKKASAYMSVAMYVIRELEDGLDDCAAQCATCNGDSVKALDEAVAFYTGSLEGKDGSGDGVLPYSLADKRCQNFKTCGENGDAITGTSKVNIDVFLHFNKMQTAFAAGNCADARKEKEEIVKHLFVPLIQGTLRYAYILENDQDAGANDKAGAEGATFAAAVLPMVAACNDDDAATIFNNMKPKSTVKDFAAVKRAFENNYSCLGITCADVGGLYDDTTEAYQSGAAPCGGAGSSSDESGVNVGLAVGLAIGGLVALLLAVFFVKRRNNNASAAVEFKGDSNGTEHI